MFMTFKYSAFNKDTEDDQALNVTIRLSLDLPTLLLISVFSAFSYYLSRLNLEVETILHSLDDPSVNTFSSRPVRATAYNSDLAATGGQQYLQFHGSQIRENTTGFAKMFFLISNILLFIFYIVCFAKCKYLTAIRSYSPWRNVCCYRQ